MVKKSAFLLINTLGTLLMTFTAVSGMESRREPGFGPPCSFLETFNEYEKYLPSLKKHSNGVVIQDTLSLAYALLAANGTIGFSSLTQVLHDAYLRLRHAITPAVHFVPKTDPLKTLPLLTQNIMDSISLGSELGSGIFSFDLFAAQP